MIEAGQLTDKLSAIRELPTFPSIALEVMRLASESESSAADLSRIISKDPSLSSRILRVANSPYYGFSKKISTIEWAIVALGFETLRETILSLTLIDLFKGAELKNFDPRSFWKHCIDTASAARSIAKEAKYRLPGEAYAVGLLHDIGILVMYRYFRNDFEEIQRLVHDDGLQPSQAEAVVVGTSHAEIGAWLAEKWNLPGSFTDAIRSHHSPSYSQVNPELSAIVHVAVQIASSNGYSCSDSPLKFDIGAVQLIGIEKLGISFKDLVNRYVNDEYSSVVKLRVPVLDGASNDARQNPLLPQTGVDDETLRRFFKDAIRMLPATERLVITLKLYEGLDLRQVSVVLGYEEARVAEYYTKAIAFLQQMAERAILTNRLDQWKTRY